MANLPMSQLYLCYILRSEDTGVCGRACVSVCVCDESIIAPWAAGIAYKRSGLGTAFHYETP